MITNGKKPRVALGMSGGVDSSVSAHLLVEAGYDITGIYLECWRAPGCRTEEDRKDALNVALKLGIPFQVLDFKQEYKDRVVEYFFDEYQKGRTPNPDVMCNKEIKFGMFYDWAMKEGFDFVATGHYAQVEKTLDNEFALTTSTDEHKDQTYFLYRLTNTQLQHILFPIGHLTKTQVREEAQKRSLDVASKKDSVGICFIGDINVHEFLKERLGENPGTVVDTKGNVIGKHNGLWFYTVGQRHGFTIQATTLVKQSDGSEINKHNIPPFYVIKKNPEKNELVVGFGTETYQKEFNVSDLHLINGSEAELNNQKLLVRIRHTGKLHPCSIQKKTKQWTVTLETAIQGIAEGQSAVFYVHTEKDNYICLGGVVITG
jgi:tRNA-specific 2-thiouridylase